jgi:26S proteasome regulatory subunit N9
VEGAISAGTASSTDLASVFAAHYEASLTYYKRVGPPEAFYEQAMQFLNYAPPPPLPSGEAAAVASPVTAAAAPKVDVTMISTTDYHQLAVDLCLAALTGDGVYNLGQVVEDQAVLLQYLKQDQQTAASDPNNFYWLVELLQSVADGNVLLFEELTQHRYAAQIARQPALVHRAAAVREKLTLLCLVWLVFQKASHERTLTFEELALALRLQDCSQTGQAAKDRVEWVVMRALSVHLMEGFIDQVDQTVTVTWILPRVLNAEQMQSLANSFAEWAGKVRSTTDSITAHQHPTSSAAAAAVTGVAAN